MPKLLGSASRVSEVEAAHPSDVLRHFEQLLTLETDCWDVYEAMKNGNHDFVLLDVRSPQMFQTGHIPGAVNLPHGRINERNLAAYASDTLFVVYCGGPHCNGADRAAVNLARIGKKVKKMIGDRRLEGRRPRSREGLRSLLFDEASRSSYLQGLSAPDRRWPASVGGSGAESASRYAVKEQSNKMLPRLDQITIHNRGRTFAIPYLYRPGTGGPAVLFVLGLGGAKENFLGALQSPELSDCTLLAFDNPGTGLADFDREACSDLSSQADVAHAVSEKLIRGPHFIKKRRSMVNGRF